MSHGCEVNQTDLTNIFKHFIYMFYIVYHSVYLPGVQVPLVGSLNVVFLELNVLKQRKTRAIAFKIDLRIWKKFRRLFIMIQRLEKGYPVNRVPCQFETSW